MNGHEPIYKKYFFYTFFHLECKNLKRERCDKKIEMVFYLFTMNNPNETMSVSKQLAMNFSVNGVKFPMEVIDIVKSFAFEDRIVAFVKQKKREIVETINCATTSRGNRNCSVCGEYCGGFNSKILCTCAVEYDADMYYDDDYDDSPELDYI